MYANEQEIEHYTYIGKLNNSQDVELRLDRFGTRVSGHLNFKDRAISPMTAEGSINGKKLVFKLVEAGEED